MTTLSSGKVQARAIALLPLIVFLAVFLGSGIYHTLIGTEFAFYQVKAPVAALPAVLVAILMYRGKLNASIDEFLKGASHPNLILMFMVFMLAGAFASVSSSIGSVEATVHVTHVIYYCCIYCNSHGNVYGHHRSLCTNCIRFFPSNRDSTSLCLRCSGGRRYVW